MIALLPVILALVVYGKEESSALFMEAFELGEQLPLNECRNHAHSPEPNDVFQKIIFMKCENRMLRNEQIDLHYLFSILLFAIVMGLAGQNYFVTAKKVSLAVNHRNEVKSDKASMSQKEVVQKINITPKSPKKVSVPKIDVSKPSLTKIRSKNKVEAEKKHKEESKDSEKKESKRKRRSSKKTADDRQFRFTQVADIAEELAESNAKKNEVSPNVFKEVKPNLTPRQGEQRTPPLPKLVQKSIKEERRSRSTKDNLIFVGGINIETTAQELTSELSDQGFNVVNKPRIRVGNSFAYCPDLVLSSKNEVRRLLGMGRIMIKGQWVDVRAYTPKEEKVVSSDDDVSVSLSDLPPEPLNPFMEHPQSRKGQTQPVFDGHQSGRSTPPHVLFHSDSFKSQASFESNGSSMLQSLSGISSPVPTLCHFPVSTPCPMQVCNISSTPLYLPASEYVYYQDPYAQDPNVYYTQEPTSSPLQLSY